MIKIASKHVEAKRNILLQGFDYKDLKARTFKSVDPKFLEKTVNEFLEDHIYVSHHCSRTKFITCGMWQFSKKTKVYQYIVVVSYMDFPF